jgi:streptogramin lyase
LDTQSQQWTIYNLPSHGTNTRFITVDNRKETVEVWAASFMTSKVVRLQFRTKQQMHSAALSMNGYKNGGRPREAHPHLSQQQSQN